MLANVYLLGLLVEEGISAYLVDAHNRVQVIDQRTVIKEKHSMENMSHCFRLWELWKLHYIKGNEISIRGLYVRSLPFDRDQ